MRSMHNDIPNIMKSLNLLGQLKVAIVHGNNSWVWLGITLGPNRMLVGAQTAHGGQRSVQIERMIMIWIGHAGHVVQYVCLQPTSK